MSPSPLETVTGFPPTAGMEAFLIGRIPGLDVAVTREEAMVRLEPFHRRLLQPSPGKSHHFITAEQIHGSGVAVVDAPSEDPVPGADGLVTTRRGLTLGIYVADCAPVWIVARDGSSGALLHSGKKGTELGIVRKGIHTLTERTGKESDEFLAVVGPCIRPPCYEVDFAADIRKQALKAGITEIHDPGICTACHPERYYSYRREKGFTGRMLATLTLV